MFRPFFKPGEILDWGADELARVEVLHRNGSIDIKTDRGETEKFTLDQQKSGKPERGRVIEYSVGQTVEVLSDSHNDTFVEAHVVNLNDMGTLDVKYGTGETKALPWESWKTQLRPLGYRDKHDGCLPVFSWDMTLNAFPQDLNNMIGKRELPSEKYGKDAAFQGVMVGSASYTPAAHGTMTLRQLEMNQYGMRVDLIYPPSI